MKKFNAKELLSRDEMKKIAGSGYGCNNQAPCGIYQNGHRVEGGYCGSTPTGCECITGPYIGQSC